MPVPIYFQKPIRLGLVAKYLWDLNAIPRQRAFELLALNCKDELEQEKLIEFTTPEGLEDMYNYTSRPRRTILEVLHDFPHATSALTIPVLFELFSIIQPRLFSIASSRKSNKLEILVAVVEYKLKLSEPRRGLCSNWLKDLQVGTTISASFRKGTMKIPRQANVPLIMVGPGTGLAPFRSILMDRWMENDGKDRNVLIFGCRSQFKDFHCKADLQKMEDEGIVKCYYAFSRDQDHKVYVQHKIEEAESELKPLIFDEHATILVAGNSKDMPQSVKEAFTRVVGSADYIEKMIKEGRYQEETWS
ncbi:unnamed protein product [Hermetia illucens]|uniref:FAD-binding FR-type domain-containing protein n=2 Tax=Hermetia illucens TaxID=343691 RepID=A0A7R8UPU1_HERIL|nr:unnamed protein product [Hermetia illucens]